MAIRKFYLPGVNMPEVNLYLCNNKIEVEQCLSKGLPALLWRESMEDLWKYILYPLVQRMFPEIKVPAPSQKKQYSFVKVPKGNGVPDKGYDVISGEKTFHTADVPDGERIFNGGYTVDSFEMDINRYVPDLSNYIDINLLADLKLLPKFMGDLATCIRTNLIGQNYKDGYNKKLKACVGNCNGGSIERNLLIVDVSNSMGAIGTLLIRLVESMRGWCNADLIITGGISVLYPYGQPLPDPKDLRRRIPTANESVDFDRILFEDLKGKHYTNVISFGDSDTPCLGRFCAEHSTIKVKHLWHYYNTPRWRKNENRRNKPTGYAKWVEKLPCKPIVHQGVDGWSKFECE